MKRCLSLITAYIMLFALFPANTDTEAESVTEVITLSDTKELTKTVHELTDNAPLLYTADESNFPSNRLIVISDSEFDYQNAQLAINDSDGMYVLIYGSKSEAEKAYDILIKNPRLDVLPDLELCVPDDVQITESDESDLGISSSHLGWGADFIGTDYFTDTLYSNYGSTDEMPEVITAVIDTGVDYDHPYLADRIIRGYDYVNGDSKPMDDHSHGTHVAGIIYDNTLDNVKILAYKTIRSDGKGSMTDTLAAIKDARNEGADIINLSVGANDPYLDLYYEFYSAYNSIINKGITLVVAAGNDSQDTGYVFPANMEEVITVTACKQSGSFDTSYSNYGSTVDLCAPGTSVRSTIWNDSYGTKSGTSMACPHVSAAAALLKTADPKLTPEEIDIYLKDSATPQGNTVPDRNYGYGLLNLKPLAEEFLSDAEHTEPPVHTPRPTAAPTPTPTPAPTPEPGLPQLVNASFLNGYVNITLSDSDDVLSDGVTVAVAAYKNNELSEFRTFETDSECINGFLLTEDTKTDTVKIYVWDSLDNPKPLSKIYHIKECTYEENS